MRVGSMHSNCIPNTTLMLSTLRLYRKLLMNTITEVNE